MNRPRQLRKTLRTDAGALIEQCAGWNSRLAARRITQFLDREMADAGLTVGQLGLMAQIAVIADDTLGALAQRSGLEQSTLSRNLRTLENKGLIEIATVETDLRRLQASAPAVLPLLRFGPACPFRRPLDRPCLHPSSRRRYQEKYVPTTFLGCD